MKMFMTGYKKMVKELDTLEPKIRGKILRKATRAGAKVLRDDVKQRLAAHVLSGDLHQSIRVRAARTADNKRLNKKKGVGHAVETPVFYASFLEFGTKNQSAEDIFSRALIAKKPKILRVFKGVLRRGIVDIGRASKAKNPSKSDR